MKSLSLVVIACLLAFSLYAEDRSLDIPTDPHVVIETKKGNIELRLFPAVAPKTVENIVELVRNEYYDNSTFYRVVPELLIQGGVMGVGKYYLTRGKKFEIEVDHSVKFDRPWLVAMILAPGSWGQFFITLCEAPWLNGKYTLFGEVVSGFEVLEEIGQQKQPRSSLFDPLPIVIQRMYLK